VGSTQLPIQWVPGIFTGAKQPGRESDRLPPSSAEVKNKWSFTSAQTACAHVVDSVASYSICLRFTVPRLKYSNTIFNMKELNFFSINSIFYVLYHF